MDRLAVRPAVLHSHDWHTALAPMLLRRRRREGWCRDIAAVLTTHNAAFQGMFTLEETRAVAGPLDPADGPSLEWYGMANWLLGRR